MIIKNLFEIGDKVVSKTDRDKQIMIVTSIWIYSTGLLYEVSFFDNTRTFYGFELERYFEDMEDINTYFHNEDKAYSLKYLKSLDYEDYIKILDSNSVEFIKEVIDMLAGEQEYEMAEVTKRYLERKREKH